ncbi:hypothetical protein ACFQ48_14315 [Hymenobacter caeli]|uniref:Uncharacterized protein n=1 Tax=Hymenobacter caeli TaxID=2735894 RepID=A0ABX2FSD2_9BACT|nr:hypothetical protein [Hymenobacter caeli]NRT20095.1 hypothetical protein [Hymenobacter caeli]
MPQVAIHPKEAATITGNGYDAAKRLLQRVRARFGKPTGSYVSVGEFCAYTGLPEPEVRAALHQALVNR